MQGKAEAVDGFTTLPLACSDAWLHESDGLWVSVCCREDLGVKERIHVHVSDDSLQLAVSSGACGRGVLASVVRWSCRRKDRPCCAKLR